MEDMSEFAGHLKAELLNNLDLFKRGRITEAEALHRLEIIRRRGESGKLHKPQHVLIFDSATEAMDSLSGVRR